MTTTKTQRLIKDSLVKEFVKNDAIIITDGAYIGWVGYAQGGCDTYGFVPLIIFSSTGHMSNVVIDSDHVINLEHITDEI